LTIALAESTLAKKAAPNWWTPLAHLKHGQKICESYLNKLSGRKWGIE
jgi:hypothetical protein